MSKNRISKVTTRAGDKGSTKTATGTTLLKSNPLIRAVGCVDELNSHVGLAIAHMEEHPEIANLTKVQQALFDIGAVLTMEGEFTAPELAAIEEATEAINATLPPLTEFVLPGGGLAASQVHVCRTTCRRAEIETWAVATELSHESIEDCARYLNRLSDYFFVLARALNDQGEALWRGPSQE